MTLQLMEYRQDFSLFKIILFVYLLFFFSLFFESTCLRLAYQPSFISFQFLDSHAVQNILLEQEKC